MQRLVIAPRFAILVIALGMFFSACDGCGEPTNNDQNNIGEGGAGKLLVSPQQVAFSQVPLGAEDVIDVQLRNVSSDPLQIFEVRLEPRDGGSIDDLSLEGVPGGQFEIAGQDRFTIQVRYAPTSTAPAAGQIVLVTSDPEFTVANPRVVPIATLANRAEIQALPSQVRFTRQPVTAPSASQTLSITNTGSAPLILTREPVYSGGGDFSITVPARTYPLELQPYPFDDPEEIENNPRDYVLEVDVRYRALGDGADTGDVLVYSNDTSQVNPDDEAEGLLEVPVLASADAPCILVDSVARNLGQVPVGQQVPDLINIENCGTQPLLISSVRILENSDEDEYELDLGSWDLDGSGDIDEPISIEPGASDSFRLDYTPIAEGTDQAKLAIFSNDPITPQQEVTIVGRGALGACPNAVAVARIKGQGATGRPSIGAAPLDYIILDGSQSTDEDGSIPNAEDNFEWEVLSSPPDAVVQLREAMEAPGDARYREVRVLLAGEYKFGLKVRDNQGFESCNQAEVVVRAVPNEKILVELTWTNPEDPDENDTVGSDVDIHMVKMGPGQWFADPYDIYFRNANSGPGSENNGIWNPESPSLDIDDTDGVGPENIQMNDPANCQWYAIGVHYYRQVFGTAYATVRIYIDGGLVFEKLNVPLQRGGQFWDVARIHWDSRQVLEVDEVLPAAPEGQEPAVTTDMASSGLCSEANLY